jgi:hypothetical protein
MEQNNPRFISISNTKVVMYPAKGEPGLTETWIAATGREDLNSKQFIVHNGITYYLVSTKVAE